MYGELQSVRSGEYDKESGDPLTHSLYSARDDDLK